MKLLLMMGLFALPTLASFAAFYWFPPTKTSNYGELISPVINLPALPLSVLDGADAKRGEGEQGLRGKWLIVTRDSGDRKSTRLNSSHSRRSRMPSSA